MTDHTKDLVKRLRDQKFQYSGPQPAVMNETADLIEAQGAEIERLNAEHKSELAISDKEFFALNNQWSDATKRAEAAEAEVASLKTQHDAYVELTREAMEQAAKDKLEVAAVKEALIRLIEFVTDEDCSFDHHGYCQAHGFMSTRCPVGIARRTLEGT